MLTMEGVPDELEQTYEVTKEIASKIYSVIEAKGQPYKLEAEKDLLVTAGENALVYIAEGYFKLCQEKKIIRLYSERDFVLTTSDVAGLTLWSDFATDIVLFDLDECLGIIASDGDLYKQWTRLMNLENKLNLSVCALVLAEAVEPVLELRQFRDRDTIIERGDAPEEIFEMITGGGTVLVDETEVGRVGVGEIFGEIGFLTGSPRTATVKAVGNCCVRVVKKEDFLPLLESNHHLSSTITKTLSKRIVELNDRFINTIP